MESVFTIPDLLGVPGLAWSVLLKVGVVLGFFLTAPLVIGYVEHKGLGKFQDRVGPYEAGIGPIKGGVGQLPADGIKFLQKEDIIPRNADKWVFALAPGVTIIPSIVMLAVIPMGPGLYIEDLDAGLFFALAVSSVSTIGILMAAWSSANKFSLMGGIREAAQLIAYELPLVLAAAGVALQAGSLSLVDIVMSQADFSLAGIVPIWFGLPQAIGLGLFFVASLAELNRPPFDIPIADAELIAGHMTEYTGLRFAFFLLTEYAGIVILSALMVVLYFGGWYPWPGFSFEVFDGVAGGTALAALLGFAVTFGKITILALVMIQLRATFPRLREDQLQRLAWLLFIPLALLQVVVIAIAKVASS